MAHSALLAKLFGGQKPDETQFFALLHEHAALFKQAIAAKCVLCIPPDAYTRSALQSFANNRQRITAFITNHLLKESPLYLDQYSTSNEKSYEIKQQTRATKNSLRILESVKGFNPPISTRILFEDTYYNDQFVPYKVWLIDKCFSENLKEFEAHVEQTLKNEPQKNEKAQDKKPETFEQFVNYLEKIYPNSLQKARAFASTFNSSFVLLRGTVFQAVQRIQASVYHIYQDQQIRVPFLDDEKCMQFKVAVQSVILTSVYDKIIAVWKEEYEQKDNQMVKYMKLLAKVKPDELGIPVLLQCEQKDAVQHLLRIDNCKCVFTKLQCFRKMHDQLVETINLNQKKHFSLSKPQVLTSDELIPLITWVLIQSNCPTLATQIDFITHLLSDELASTALGFIFASVQAAAAFLETEALKLKPTLKPLKDLNNQEKEEEQEEVIQSAPITVRRSFSEVPVLSPSSPQLDVPLHKVPRYRRDPLSGDDEYEPTIVVRPSSYLSRTASMDRHAIASKNGAQPLSQSTAPLASSSVPTNRISSLLGGLFGKTNSLPQPNQPPPAPLTATSKSSAITPVEHKAIRRVDSLPTPSVPRSFSIEKKADVGDLLTSLLDED